MKTRATSVAELALALGGEVCGDGELVLTDVQPIEKASTGHVTFVANPKYARHLATTEASCVIVGTDVDAPAGRTVIRCAQPYLAFAQAVGHIRPAPPLPPVGVHPKASVDPSATLGDNVRIGANVAIAAEAVVGAGATLYPNVVVGHGATVGADAILYPNVVLYHHVEVGARSMLHAGVVIGGDGFGFATDASGTHHKVPQSGNVVIEDDVEIGANTTIDRAVLGTTRIGRGSKIDNQVQIAHNVTLGTGCLVAAQVGIAGSTQIGDFCMFGAQAGIVGHLEIGDRAIIGAKSGVARNIPAGKAVLGQPAIAFAQTRRVFASLPKLPELRLRVGALERELAELKAAIKRS